MFLPIREFRHSKLRHVMIVGLIGLVAWLVFLLSGLANGLAFDNGATLRQMDADYLTFQEGVRLFLHRSILPSTKVDEMRNLESVADATPIGHLTVTVRRSDVAEQVDATMLAVDPNGFLAPDIVEGDPLDEGVPNGVVVDKSLKQHGVRLKDVLQVMPAGTEIRVVGFTEDQKYNHLPVIYANIPLWQGIRFAVPGASGGVEDPVSAVAVRVRGDEARSSLEGVDGVEVASLAESVQNLPGYKEEMGTISLMLGFLFLIAAFVIAVFFYVLTLQKTNQLGILKALGATSGFLVRDLVQQVMLLTLLGVVVGADLTYLVAAAIPPEVPFNLQGSLVMLYGLTLIAVSLLGTLVSLRQIARIDPLIAIGRAD